MAALTCRPTSTTADRQSRPQPPPDRAALPAGSGGAARSRDASSARRGTVCGSAHDRNSGRRLQHRRRRQPPLPHTAPAAGRSLVCEGDRQRRAGSRTDRARPLQVPAVCATDTAPPSSAGPAGRNGSQPITPHRRTETGRAGAATATDPNGSTCATTRERARAAPRSLRFRWRATRQRRRLGHHTRPGCPNSAVETFRRRQASFGWLRAAPAGRKMPFECGHPSEMVMTGGAVRLTIRFPLPAAGTAGGGGANPHSTQPPPATQPGRQHSAAIPGAQRNTTSRAH